MNIRRGDQEFGTSDSEMLDAKKFTAEDVDIAGSSTGGVTDEAAAATAASEGIQGELGDVVTGETPQFQPRDAALNSATTSSVSGAAAEAFRDTPSDGADTSRRDFRGPDAGEIDVDPFDAATNGEAAGIDGGTGAGGENAAGSDAAADRASAIARQLNTSNGEAQEGQNGIDGQSAAGTV